MTVLDEIAAERARQIESEGWTPEHDDEHDDGALARAAACYAVGFIPRESTALGALYPLWPWDKKWWKPKSPRRNLVRAAALIVAEIERHDRAAGSAAIRKICDTFLREGPAVQPHVIAYVERQRDDTDFEEAWVEARGAHDNPVMTIWADRRGRRLGVRIPADMLAMYGSSLIVKRGGDGSIAGFATIEPDAPAEGGHGETWRRRYIDAAEAFAPKCPACGEPNILDAETERCDVLICHACRHAFLKKPPITTAPSKRHPALPPVQKAPPRNPGWDPTGGAS